MHLSFTITLAALLAAASSMAFPSYGEHHSSPSYPDHRSSYPDHGSSYPDHGPSYLARRAPSPIFIPIFRPFNRPTPPASSNPPTTTPPASPVASTPPPPPAPPAGAAGALVKRADKPEVKPKPVAANAAAATPPKA